MEVLYEGGVATAMQQGVWGNDVPPPIREDRPSCTVWLTVMRNRLGRESLQRCCLRWGCQARSGREAQRCAVLAMRASSDGWRRYRWNASDFHRPC